VKKSKFEKQTRNGLLTINDQGKREISLLTILTERTKEQNEIYE